jgi:cysteine desulfurase
MYFDYAATTPADPVVVEAMLPWFFEKFGNPSSPHALGQEAAAALEAARETVAGFIGASPADLIFNSGATEGNNHALSGVVEALMGRGGHIIISAVEHHSVMEPAAHLAQSGFEVEVAPVDALGRADPGDIRRRITDQTILVAVIHASNEIGTIQPVAEIGAAARERGVPFLVDACQTVGHIPVDARGLNADIMTFSAHKFYGPKGVGGLYVRPGTPLFPFFLGGDQERGRRASTQNVAGAVGMAAAAELCRGRMAAEAEKQTRWRERLMEEVPRRIEGVTVNGDRRDRLPNNVHFSFAGLDGQGLLIALDKQGVCVSRGSACAAGAMTPSHVLKAVGLSDSLARGSLRLTLGRWTTDEQVEHLINVLPSTVARLRSA